MGQGSETFEHEIIEHSDNQISLFSRPPYPTTGWGGKMETEPIQPDFQTDGPLSAGWKDRCTEIR